MTFTIASNSVYDPIHSQIQGQLTKPEKDHNFPFKEDTHTCLASCCFAQHPFHPLSKDSTLLPPPCLSFDALSFLYSMGFRCGCQSQHGVPHLDTVIGQTLGHLAQENQSEFSPNVYMWTQGEKKVLTSGVVGLIYTWKYPLPILFSTITTFLFFPHLFTH